MKELDWKKIGANLFFWQGILAITSIVTVLGVFLVVGNKLPPQIPLFYSLPWGEEQLSRPVGLIYPILVVLFSVGLSFISKISKIDRILAAVVSGVGLAGEIILISGIVRIILIII
jgi:hypothetical protein